MNLFFNPNLSPRGSVVISQTNPTAIPIRDFVFDNILGTNLYMVDGLGGYDANSGNPAYSVRVGIGLPGTELDWVNTNWTPITNGWHGTIATNSTGLQTLFTTLASNPINCELEITIFDDAGDESSHLITPIKIWNRVAPTSDLIIPPATNPVDGEFPIPSGVDFVTVTGLALSAVPRCVFVNIRKPAGGLNLFGSVVTGSVTAGGFEVDFNGITDASTYKLDYYLIF